mmetsp:Transcript_13109/g.1169  ORF Transcript_13109/g.1169 Transcript_13109/m.1169 type:complete len:127 (+) Transcript_13109:234-614(+)
MYIGNLFFTGILFSNSPESLFSFLFNFFYSFHSLNSLYVYNSVIYHGFISFFFKIETSIFSHVFTMSFSISFGPSHFSRIMLGFEMFMTFGSTESKYFTIISNKSHTMTRIHRSGTEVTTFNSHYI